jgi:hypothetical protein
VTVPATKTAAYNCRLHPMCYVRPAVRDPYGCEDWSDCCGLRFKGAKCGSGSTCVVKAMPGCVCLYVCIRVCRGTALTHLSCKMPLLVCVPVHVCCMCMCLYYVCVSLQTIRAASAAAPVSPRAPSCAIACTSVCAVSGGRPAATTTAAVCLKRVFT